MGKQNIVGFNHRHVFFYFYGGNGGGGGVLAVGVGLIDFWPNLRVFIRKYTNLITASVDIYT